LLFLPFYVRINLRFFNIDNRGAMRNPPPGTVVDHTVTRRDWFDFLLVSQHVTQVQNILIVGIFAEL
jgi:aubergine-like protein